MAKPLEGKRVLFVIAPKDFRDEELAVPRKAVEEAGAKTTIASTKTGPCDGMLGARVEATASLDQVKALDYDAVVVVGGAGSPKHLWEHKNLHQVLRDTDASGKVVAGICLSGAALARAGVLKGRNATVWKSDPAIAALREGGATYRAKVLEVDAGGRIITADGPTSAKMFAEKIVAALSGARA